MKERGDIKTRLGNIIRFRNGENDNREMTRDIILKFFP